MKPARKGTRHALLLYRRTMDRLWEYTLTLAIVMATAGLWDLLIETPIFGLSSKLWLLATAILAFMVSVYAFFARLVAYVQATANTLNVVTPFIRMKISYRRIQSVHPVLLQQLFPPEESSWAQKSYLSPFYGKTALVAELRGFPLSPAFLRIFWPVQMFSPQSMGLVLLVSDWMKLSTEVDSFYGAWLQSQGVRARGNSVRR